MRTSLSLDDDVHEAARARARSTGQRLGKVVSDMARIAMRSRRPRQRRSARFATFDVPADSPIISAERVRRAIAGEGIV